MIEYEDFSIKIEPQREDIYPVVVLRSPAGEGRASFRPPFDPDALGDILLNLGQTVRSGSQRPARDVAPGATGTLPQQVGDQLFNALFSGPVRSLLDQSLGMIREREKGLRIKLHIDPEDASLARLAGLPWELMYRKETRDFLNLSRYTPILRYLDVQVPYVPLALEPPLHILVVISSPVDCARLDLEHEREQIERTWAQQENVEVRFLERPAISHIQERLEREPFHALHYMGHGGFDRQSGSGVLLLEDDSGCGVPVDGRTLGVLLRDVPSLRLVFLNACETARVSGQVGLDPFAGVAAAIVMAGVPAVVAMQFPISDAAAIRFASRFYPLTALGEPVDYAVAEGRRAIRVAESDTMEWATPILFMRAPDGVLFRVAEAQRVKRRRRQVPSLDKEQEQRLERLYIAGLSAYWLEEWDSACRHFQEIVDEKPDYKDTAARLKEAERRWHQQELYNEAQEARQAGSWTMVLSRLEELVTEAPNYKDAAALLETARRQKHLADLYGQARQLHQAGQWLAVVRVFDQVAALDPSYPDPDDLLATARREAAEQERQAELNDLYSRSVLEMDAGHWEPAQQLLTRLQAMEPGFRQADRLLDRVQGQIALLEEERRRQEQIGTLYEQAQSLARARQWRPALAKMDEVHALDSGFADPEDIAARAREQVDQEETEARRQNELATLYAEAVHLLKAERHQEALQKWGEVQALDPHYPDRKKVQATARQKLAGLAQPAARRQWPRWATFALIGSVLVAAVVVAVLVADGLPGRWCPEDALFCEDFETGKADGWILEPGWVVAQDGDNYVLRVSIPAFAYVADGQPALWGDYRVRFRLKLEEGAIHLGFRHASPSLRRYYVEFSEWQLDLDKQVFNEFSNLARGGVSPPYNRWCDVEILAVGAHLQVYVDGDLRLDYTDTHPLWHGGISFETFEMGTGVHSRAMVDDVEVILISEAAP